MRTQKPLQYLVEELLQHINVNYQNQVVYNRKLLDIHEGGLLKYVEESMAKELNARAFERSKERIAPINVLSKVIEKLSRVYSEPVLRKAGENTIDQTLLAYYETQFDIDNQLNTANELLNLNKSFALEPYLNDDGRPAMRVLPADKFIVWSDNPLDPNVMTVFIKFMGTLRKSQPTVNSEGVKTQSAANAIKDVSLFYVYSDDEFMMMDSDGEILEYQPNPFGQIPFIYSKSSAFSLVPTPDTDNLSMAILIPKMLTDLNYAVKMCSHTILYGIDVQLPANAEMNPDAMWELKSVSRGDGTQSSPQLSVIKPEVDSDKVLALINSEMAMWLDSKGLKTGSIGTATVENAASGISKLIDSADSSAVTRKQIALFRKVEFALWDLVNKMHRFWVATQQLKDQSQAFSTGFNPSVKFGDAKVVVDTKTVLEELKIQFELGLVTVKQALQRLNPDMDDTQIQLLINELEAEAAKTNTKPETKLVNSYSVGSQQPNLGSAGTSGLGNTVGGTADQKPSGE